jgi:hypothetical protein
MLFDPKSRSALLALARTRRLARAQAHAYLHDGGPPGALRGSLGYLTATACTTAEAVAAGRAMRALGVELAEGAAYVVEESVAGGDRGGIVGVYRLWLAGPRAGELSVVDVGARDPAAVLAAVGARLAPVVPAAPEAWMLSTRVVQRRALRVPGRGERPIRKLTLQLEPVSGPGPSGSARVTAFLRPQAQLVEVGVVDARRALARVRYCGIPSGPGSSTETIVLLSSPLAP